LASIYRHYPRSYPAHKRPRVQSPAANKVAAPTAAEAFVIAAAFALAVVGYYADGDFQITANVIVPILQVFGLGVGIVNAVRRSFDAIWTPLVWCRVAFIFYFGIGSIVPGFVNDETLRLIEAFYSFFPSDVAKYNLVNCTFLVTFLMTSALALRSAGDGKRVRNVGIEKSAFDARTLGLILIGIGWLIYFPFTLPANLGVEDATGSLLFTQIANGIYIGIFLVTIWALKNQSPLFYFTLAITIMHFAFGVIVLAKYEAILPVIMFGLAFVYHRKSLSSAALTGIFVYIVFSLISSPISYARIQAGNTEFGFGASSIPERVEILLSYRGGDENDDKAQVQSGWARLSYVNGGTFAINDYDAGMPGTSFEHLLIVWLPRVIYPSKPNLTDKAIEFNRRVTGSDTSASTPGIPSEGYWNFGWLGVIFVAAVMGAVFSAWSVYTVMVLQSGAWHLFFVVLLGMRTGTRVDGLFVTDVIGPIGYAILGHVILQFLNRVIVRRMERNTRSLAA
jgi:hypothetical protein